MSDIGLEKLFTKDDNHFVFVRPNAIIASSGSTWVSETIRLRQYHPDVFEVATEQYYSIKVRQYCAVIHEACFLYHSMTMESDFKKGSGRKGCLFTQYEKERLDHLQQIESACSQYGDSDNMDEQKMLRGLLDIQLNELTNEFYNYEEIDMTCKENFHTLIMKVSQICQQVLEKISEFQLPIVKPMWCDLTDAGPGVGISNFEVRFRDAELCQIYNSDHRIRLHRSRGDTGQGEAERTNSAIGDSIVDGSTIEWEKFKKFEGLSKEAVKSLKVQDFERLEKERMQTDAWFVANLLVERIDGAPVLRERKKAYLSEVKEKQFFFNQKYLVQYYSTSSPSARKDIPGANYFDKILRLFEAHFKVGELFMECVKFGCASNICKCCIHGMVNVLKEFHNLYLILTGQIPTCMSLLHPKYQQKAHKEMQMIGNQEQISRNCLTMEKFHFSSRTRSLNFVKSFM